MKRYFVIAHRAKGNEHLNLQDLLPAACRKITGIAVIATAKLETETVETSETLPFPKRLAMDLLGNKAVRELFYSYLRTRKDESESRDFFESNVLPTIGGTLAKGIVYDCLGTEERAKMEQRINDLYETRFADYLYGRGQLFELGKTMNDIDFTDTILWNSLSFLYLNGPEAFTVPIKKYERPKPYECGNLSLLVNGNSFLLRDYSVTANRKVKHLGKELIPFNEPLDTNSDMHTVFKNNGRSGGDALSLRTLIEYEHE